MGFDSFVGNAEAVARLREMLATERVPHALLFVGPEGVGKKALAVMFAKALNCERLRDDFCGECRRCVKAEEMLDATRRDLAARRERKDASGRTEGLVYFDLQLIEPLTRFILIEQIRQLRTIAFTQPFEFPRRVFVVDQAQAVHWQAVDLILKVLEEAPETTTIILVCPNRLELRPAIRSRCRLVQFATVDEPTISEVLAAEGRIPQAQRALVARLVTGSVARAKTFSLEEYKRKRRPWLEFLSGLLDDTPGRSGPPNWGLLFDSTKALAENREEFQETVRMGYSLLGDLLRVLEGQPDSEVTNIDVLRQLKTWAPKLQLKGLECFKNGLDDAYRLYARNVNLQLGFDTLAAELHSVVGSR
jgi:DNA polymerase-3 subunit delta'